MKWRFDDLLTFLLVMETGSITAAAARLNLSKSVVSRRISDLEAALDIELFQRSTRHVKATESGESFYGQMRPLVQEMRETAERVSSRREALHGRLRITAPMSFGTMYLGPVIAEFARQHPELELALDYEDRKVDLVRNGYDVGVRIGILRDSSLISRRLCASRRIVCCSPAYARQEGLPKSIAELAAHDCIDYAYVHTSQLWQFESRTSAGKSVVLRSRIVVNNGEAMRDLAVAGLGIALLPLFLAGESLRAGTLIPALPNETPLPDSVHAVYPPTRHVSAKVRVFVDHLVRLLRPPPPWERELPDIPGLGRLGEPRRAAAASHVAGERRNATNP